MRRRRALTVLAAVGLSDCLGARAAAARELEPGQSVFDRPMPAAYEAHGLRLGAFKLLPDLRINEQYNDNVFARPDDVQGDFATIIAPRLDIRSNWSQHLLQAQAFSRIIRHSKFDTEDTEDVTAQVNGRLDVRRDHHVTGRVRYQSTTEERGSIDVVDGSTTARTYSQLEAELGSQHRFNRLELQLRTRYSTTEYSDLKLRNVERLRFGSRLSYEVSPRLNAFTDVSYEIRQFPNAGSRDNSVINVLTGTTFDINTVISGELGAGVFIQEPKSRGVRNAQSIVGLALNGTLIWNPTRRTSVIADISRESVPSSSGIAATTILSEFRLEVQHLLRQNIRLSAETTFQLASYTNVNRNDQVFRLTASSEYVINRNVGLGLKYTYRTRNSDFPTLNYDNNVIEASLRFRM